MCADIATAVGLGVLSTSSPFSKSPSWSSKDHLCCNSDITEHMVQLWVGWPYEPPLLTSIDLRHIRQYYLETYLSLSFLYFYVSVFLQSLQYGKCLETRNDKIPWIRRWLTGALNGLSGKMWHYSRHGLLRITVQDKCDISHAGAE